MSEHDDQAALVAYVLTVYAQREDFRDRLFFAVPNGAMLGGRVPAAQMAKLKREGLRTGVADILYLQPRGFWAYLAIELKAEERRNKKNGGLSEDQQAWLKQARGAGALGAVCWNFDEARAIFDDYMREDEATG